MPEEAQQVLAAHHALRLALDQHMSPPLPQVGSGEPVSALVTALEKADAAVVLVEGKPQGVVSRQDLLGFLSTDA